MALETYPIAWPTTLTLTHKTTTFVTEEAIATNLMTRVPPTSLISPINRNEWDCTQRRRLISLSLSSIAASSSFGISSPKMFIESFKVESPNVTYTDDEIQSVYSYETTELVHVNRNGTYEWVVKPKTVKYEFKTDIHVPKLGYNINQRFYSYLHKTLSWGFI